MLFVTCVFAHCESADVTFSVKVFDLLYLNGVSLLRKSTKYRKRNLRSCFKEVKGRLEFVTEFEGKTAKDVRRKMEDIMANRGEGLVLKHPDAEYVLNGRNKDWIKVGGRCLCSGLRCSPILRQVKPEYMVSKVYGLQVPH